MRRKTREIKIGNVRIGGNNPVAIQSMAKTRTADVPATVRQILRLEKAGCEIIRVAVKDRYDALAISRIKKNIHIPLVADIHFDWRLALSAIDSGADKIRLNPGNIRKKEQIKAVASAAKSAGIPIRVGLNSGSVGGSGDQASRMAKYAREYLGMLEGFGFRDIVVSAKAQNPADTIKAYRLISAACGYPLHLGVTATGLAAKGLLKSAVAIGALLLEGIGDTIRISLTDKPEEEVKSARLLLESLGLRRFGPEVISCPTCGRCEVDLVRMVKELERKLFAYGGHLCRLDGQVRASAPQLPAKPITVAVMGCVVNGPGEAKHADLGIAFGRKDGLFFKKGKPMRKIPAKKCVDALLDEINKF
ncbi:MAG: flavodoxin-dependent (E)-4-hydroxy-3-methylbut-2-enyl-diphosphate synthase [Candidatus Omnitrophica bacterium]|jgi:(E)-4-hydroxy-3-methylbut-2-enyl-diphosphate synthase|nr:flavodoxin-dependent (E)-4-hydroxy-3-methylbut-2-enyl-diphosphate synthase [Candidatus Omnitrophota bacterium]MDD5079480.1 flavodoxin-dependent (E)-4-hydroxy-3-methylbut-2-enyl-diphosphate synthase [Candidatus Omnitrophota bacterium]